MKISLWHKKKGESDAGVRLRTMALAKGLNELGHQVSYFDEGADLTIVGCKSRSAPTKTPFIVDFYDPIYPIFADHAKGFSYCSEYFQQSEMNRYPDMPSVVRDDPYWWNPIPVDFRPGKYARLGWFGDAGNYANHGDWNFLDRIKHKYEHVAYGKDINFHLNSQLAWMRKQDIMVLSNVNPKARFKSSNKAVESLAQGIPVAHTPQPSLEKLKDGIFINDWLCEAVDYMLDHPKETIQRTEHGQQIVLEHYNHRAIAQKYLDDLEEINLF